MIKDQFKYVWIKKLLGMFKDKLGWKIMIEYCALRAKTHAYLMEDGSEIKKGKGVKRSMIDKEWCLKTIKIHCLIMK